VDIKTIVPTPGEIHFPNLCTPSEIAKLLKVSPKSIYYWVKRDELPFIRVGRHLRFDPQKVISYLTEKTDESKAPCLKDPFLVEKRTFSRSLKTRTTRNVAAALSEKE
jgi:excisionase family DNA binding protein